MPRGRTPLDRSRRRAPRQERDRCRGGCVISGHLDSAVSRRHRSLVHVYAVVDESLAPWSMWAVMDVCVRREDAERFVEEVRGDEPELALYLRIEERELEAGGRN
jgi:hypothetical protein